MGIDIGCCLIVGLPADDFTEDIIGDKDLYDYVHDNDLHYSSPWYDSGVGEGVIGYMLAHTDSFEEVEEFTFEKEYYAALVKFKELIKKEPKLYLSNHVT